MLNFAILMVAMCASGAIGFFLAREKYLGNSDQELHLLEAEIKRMRRRTREAEAQSDRFKFEHDRMKRTARAGL